MSIFISSSDPISYRPTFALRRVRLRTSPLERIVGHVTLWHKVHMRTSETLFRFEDPCPFPVANDQLVGAVPRDRGVWTTTRTRSDGTVIGVRDEDIPAIVWEGLANTKHRNLSTETRRGTTVSLKHNSSLLTVR
jgi:hypothetical protein